MAYHLDDKTIYYNIFYAVQDLTRILSTRDICTFRNYLEETIKISAKQIYGMDNGSIIFDKDDEYFLESNKDDFTLIDETIIYIGKEITRDMIGDMNYHIMEEDLYVALVAARMMFREYLEDRISLGTDESSRFYATIF